MWGLLALELKFISLKLEPVIILVRKSGISCMATLNVIPLFSVFIDPTCSLLETKEMPGAMTIQKGKMEESRRNCSSLLNPRVHQAQHH